MTPTICGSPQSRRILHSHIEFKFKTASQDEEDEEEEEEAEEEEDEEGGDAKEKPIKIKLPKLEHCVVLDETNKQFKKLKNEDEQLRS